MLRSAYRQLNMGYCAGHSIRKAASLEPAGETNGRYKVGVLQETGGQQRLGFLTPN